MDATQLSRYLALGIGLVQPWDHSNEYSTSPSIDDDFSAMHRGTTSLPVNETSSSSSHETILRRGARADDTSYSQPRIGDQADDQGSWWYTFIFIVAFFVVVFGSYLIREGFVQLCGCEQAPQHHSRHGRRRDAASSPLSREDRLEEKMQKQRQERRLWYQYFLKPYTVVLTASHFESKEEDADSFEKEEEPDLEMGIQDPHHHSDEEQTGAPYTCIHFATDEEMEAEHQDTTTNQTGTGLIAAMEETTKMMTLWDPHDTCYREMEANCTICYEDYKVGDTLVRSAADEEDEYCTHVFHYECMLGWLEKGKKRCPICRHWFVPAIRIHQQMKEAHVETDPNSLRHLYDTRTLQGVATLDNDSDSDDEDTESNMSRSSTDGEGDEDTTIAHGHHTRGRGGHHHHHGHHHHQRHVSLIDPAHLAWDLDNADPPLAATTHHGASTATSAELPRRHHRRHSYPSHGPLPQDALVFPSEFQATIREWSLPATFDV